MFKQLSMAIVIVLRIMTEMQIARFATPILIGKSSFSMGKSTINGYVQ
jgi:hypothetical protein